MIELLDSYNLDCFTMEFPENQQNDDDFESFIESMHEDVFEEEMVQMGSVEKNSCSLPAVSLTNEIEPIDLNQQSPLREFLSLDIELEENDIVCGRDKLTHSHIGNKRFRRVIESNRERYQTATSREEKTRITIELVEMLQSSRPGGRFLKKDPSSGAWLEVGDEYVREKVSHALRSAKDPNRIRVRKKRKVVQRIFTDDENRTFNELLEDQQRIFDSLVQRFEAQESDVVLSVMGASECSKEDTDAESIQRLDSSSSL